MPTIIDGNDGVNKIDFSEIATGTPSSSTFLRGDGAWATAGSPPGTLQLLQQDIITTSGTWTRAAGFDANDTVMIFLVGGGGSGGAARVNTERGSAQGGAAGGTLLVAVRYGDFPSTAFTLTVGTGGAAVTRATTSGGASGNSGGQTTLTNANPQCIFNSTGGPGGDGAFSASQMSVNGAPSTVNFVQGIGGAQVGAGSLNNFIVNWIQRARPLDTDFDFAVTANFSLATPPNNVFSGGGSAARQGATDRASWNAPAPALFAGGGAGSGTTNGANATGMGGGGGGCVRQNADATSGAGGSGGMIVRYYRGRVSPFQVLGAVGV